MSSTVPRPMALKVCAINNTRYALPSIIALFWALYLCHEKGWQGQERICCAVIGWLFGWIMALWGAVLVASNPRKDKSVL